MARRSRAEHLTNRIPRLHRRCEPGGRGRPVETRETRLFIVDNRLLLVPIAVRQITPQLKGRLRQYLRLLDLKLGLIANFHPPSLEIEIARIW